MSTPLRRKQQTPAVADVSRQLSDLVEALVELVSARVAEAAPAQQSSGRAAYSVKEFAALLGVHLNTIYREVQSGAIASVRIGGEYRIPHAELERLLASGEAGAA